MRKLLIALLAASPALAWQPDINNIDNVIEQQAPVQQRRGDFQRNRLNWNGFGHQNDLEVGQVAAPRGFDGRLTAAAIARAIDDGVLFLKRQQAEDGGIGEAGYAQGGSTGLAALAMLAAGLSPLTDPQLKRALDYLAAMAPDSGGGGHGSQGLGNTYVRGIRANVWEYALRLDPDNATYRKALEDDARWMLAALEKNGRAWRYGMDSTDWDNSCTQYGVLGLWAAERAGFDPGDAAWKKMSDHFLGVQNEDGGWGYTGAGSSANMATAGLASTFLVFDMLYARDVYRRGTPNESARKAAKVLAAIDRGMAWLGSQQSGLDNGYYLYGIERTGVASGRKYFGGLDWFKEGAKTVLGQQLADGSIPNSYSPVLGTAFSTLFLVYGGAPVALNKLEFGNDQDWNRNPRDLAQVSKHLWTAYERPLNWHTVSIEAPVEELEAPILFLSGTEAVKFSEAQVAKLRDYIQRGGTVLAEASDRAPEFTKSMEVLAGQLFPASTYPERTLKPLDTSHAIFTGARHAWKSAPKLRGLSDGSRVVFMLSDDELSARWQRGETDDDAFAFALSLLFYVTDARPLVGKFASDLPEKAAAEARDRVLRVGQVAVDGTPTEELGARTWARFAPWFKHQTGAELQVVAEANLSPNGLKGIDFLHLTGRRAFDLDETERVALAAFVDGGGQVLVDPWGGSPTFQNAARRELEAVFGPLSGLTGDEPVVVGDFEGGSDLTRDVRYTLPARRALLAARRAADSLHLDVARVDGQPAVFFSTFDLSAALAGVGVPGAVGYDPATARRIVANLVGYRVRET